MTDQEHSEWVTRKLNPAELENKLAAENENTAPLDQPVPWVIELRVVGTPAVFQVRVQGELVIGRSDPRYDNKPDIDLEPFDAYQQGVSRRHAMIYPKNNRLLLADLGSSNGTFINGRTLSEGQEYRLRHGDTMVIGKMQLQISFAVMPSSHDLSAERTQPLKINIPRIGAGEHVLVVDPDEDVAYVLGSVLQQAGFKVTLVQTFAEAMGFINKQLPHALLTELMLPDISGLELVRYIRDQHYGKTMPILVVTSATGGFQMGQALDAGVDIFLSKPVGIDELVRGIGKLTAQMQTS
jgi:CheY-like chemotaxis protein